MNPVVVFIIYLFALPGVFAIMGLANECDKAANERRWGNERPDWQEDGSQEMD